MIYRRSLLEENCSKILLEGALGLLEELSPWYFLNFCNWTKFAVIFNWDILKGRRSFQKLKRIVKTLNSSRFFSYQKSVMNTYITNNIRTFSYWFILKYLVPFFIHISSNDFLLKKFSALSDVQRQLWRNYLLILKRLPFVFNWQNQLIATFEKSFLKQNFWGWLCRKCQVSDRKTRCCGNLGQVPPICVASLLATTT